MALVFVGLFPANAEDKPYGEGHFGVGHEKHHPYYYGLHNLRGAECCNDQDCRPTTAKYVEGKWWAKVDGEWRPMEDDRRTQEYPYSWNEEAHVCANKTGYIYCFIPGGSGG